jgi:hypothetical protein
MEAPDFFEMFMQNYKITQHHIPEELTPESKILGIGYVLFTVILLFYNHNID